jgi:hypothetical protein
MRTNGVRTLLIGGQACVLYGAAQISRDVDLLIGADQDNLARLRLALGELDAIPIAVPELDPVHLEAGHGVHFRCRREDVEGLRVDVMSRLRGGIPFETLWSRHIEIETPDGPVDVISYLDLVQAKKTQRDKDWLMIQRLVEQHYFKPGEPSAEDIAFWLRELRSPELLIEATARFPAEAELSPRPAVAAAKTGDPFAVEEALHVEERIEKNLDRDYWVPLRKELEFMRHQRRAQSSE